MKKFKWTIYLIFAFTFIIILTANFIIMIKSFINPNEVPGIFGYKPMIVMTASMEDSIMTGDLVFAKNCNPSDLKVNDIISYRDENNTIITHRIVEIKKENELKFITKGDNNNSPDTNPVISKQIEGLYVGRIAKLGSFLVFIQTPIGIVVSLLSITVVCLTIWIISNKSNSKETEEEKKLKKEFEEYKKNKLGENK